MKKIAVLCTGGTLAMMPSAQGLIQNPDFPEVLKRFLLSHQQQAEVIAHATLDSSSATPQDWLNLARHLFELKDDFDAFVVLHGTDTMAYSAAALHHLLSAYGLQIVLTGAQRPLCYEHSDAPSNILGALAFARLDWQGISLYFNGDLLAGDGARKMDCEGNQAFISPHQALWGEYRAGEALFYRHNAPQTQKIDLNQIQLQQVAWLYLTPGMPASAYACLQDTSVKRIILQSYGAGNLPRDAAFLEALRAAQARGVKIYNSSQCCFGALKQDDYASGAGHLRLIAGGSHTPENLYVRCVLGLDE